MKGKELKDYEGSLSARHKKVRQNTLQPMEVKQNHEVNVVSNDVCISRLRKTLPISSFVMVNVMDGCIITEQANRSLPSVIRLSVKNLTAYSHCQLKKQRTKI